MEEQEVLGTGAAASSAAARDARQVFAPRLR